MISLAGDAIAGAIIGFWNAKKIGDHMRLVRDLSFAWIATFSFTCGTALTLHRPVFEAVGTGMVLAGAMMTKTWRANPLTKGSTVSLPAKEAEIELNTDTQTITK